MSSYDEGSLFDCLPLDLFSKFRFCPFRRFFRGLKSLSGVFFWTESYGAEGLLMDSRLRAMRSIRLGRVSIIIWVGFSFIFARFRRFSASFRSRWLVWVDFEGFPSLCSRPRARFRSCICDASFRSNSEASLLSMFWTWSWRAMMVLSR